MEPPILGVLGDRVDRSATWSGSPAGLVGALRDLGAQVVTVDAHLPRLAAAGCRAWLRTTSRPSKMWERTPEAMRAREAWGRHRSRKAGVVDGWVQVGSEMGAPLPGGTFVTFDDMTVHQARCLPNPYFARIDERSFAGWDKTQRRVLQTAQAACVASRWAACSVVNDYGIRPDRVAVVGLGANLELEPRPRNWEEPRFLFVGLDWERKNGPAVLEAFARLRSELGACRLDVVGDHPRLDQPGVYPHGRLSQQRADQRAELADLFTAATCLVVPSSSEPFGIVYLEAASAGVASIGTTIGGAAEPIGDAGMLVDPADPLALLTALRLMADPETARSRGEAAHRRSRWFTWKRVAARTARALGILLTDEPEPYLTELSE